MRDQARVMSTGETKMKNKASGFSLIELVIVVGIILCLAAIAFPKIQGVMEGVRLRSSVTEISGIVQQLRIQSVRANRSYAVRTSAATAGNGVTLYIDTNGNAQLDTNEPSIQLPTDTNLSDGTGAPAVLPTGVAIPPYVVGNPTTVWFNERGTPCNNPPSCNISSPFLVYIQQTRPSGTPGWGAITVTQAGRIKAYTYTGGAAGTWQ
jgi:prepilin-type N-terminal cleavage/methylation domain-containing protein